MENPWGEEPLWARDEEDGETDDDDFDGITWFGAHHVIALIDCSSAMFTPCIDWHNDTDMRSRRISSVDAALLACERLGRNRVLQVATRKTGKRDGLGVVLYGTRTFGYGDDEEVKDDEQITASQSSTHTLVELMPPGIQQIRILQSFLEDPIRGRRRIIQTEFQNRHDDAGLGRHLRAGIQAANKAYLESKFVKNARIPTQKSPGDLKSIWIFTNQDNPHQGRQDEKLQLAQIMADLVEGGTDFVVWGLPKTDVGLFDTSILFSDLPCVVHAPPIFDLADLLESVCHQAKKTRRILRLPMILPDWKMHNEGSEIMVNFYQIVQEQRRPQAKWINQATKQETERVTKTIIKETGEVVLTTGAGDANSDFALGRDRILHFATFGSDRVFMSPADVAMIKKLSNPDTNSPSLILLGFKPQDAIPLTSLVEKSYFIYPTDEIAPGSIDAFANLHAAMSRKNVVAIGELLTRMNSSSRMVAIFPQEERRAVLEDGSDDQITPPGMIVVTLPFEDDVRAMESDTQPVVVTENLVNVAMDLIRHQKLKAVEVGINFENAFVAKFWTYVESVALETTIPSFGQHEIELNVEEVLNAARSQIEAFRASLPEDVKYEAKPNEPIRKRKSVELGDDKTGIDWGRLYLQGSISDCKVDDLKSYLKSVGARTSGRKADLVIRVTQNISRTLAEHHHSN